MDKAWDYIYSFTELCCAGAGGRTGGSGQWLQVGDGRYRIEKFLGEGGFSLVYLVNDEGGSQYAMKKVPCPFGEESLRKVNQEIEAYSRFRHDSIIQCINHSVTQEPNGSKTVYMILPYYRKGNLQDIIDRCVMQRSTLSENWIRARFIEICIAVQQLHEHVVSADTTMASDNVMQPLVSAEVSAEHQGLATGDLLPFAHRDLKPGNIMLDDSETMVVLMDFGSAVPARQTIKDRKTALQVQDSAAENCTMPYRAPELSLGCVLYALMYQHSPFETADTSGQGGSIALAVMNGKYEVPSQDVDGYSPEIKEIIQSCLQVDPEKRPDIQQLLQKAQSLPVQP